MTSVTTAKGRWKLVSTIITLLVGTVDFKWQNKPYLLENFFKFQSLSIKTQIKCLFYFPEVISLICKTNFPHVLMERAQIWFHTETKNYSITLFFLKKTLS